MNVINKAVRAAAIATACLAFASCGQSPASTAPPAPNQFLESAGNMPELINRARAEHNLKPLSHSSVLDAVAKAHGADMSKNDFFGHVSSNGDHIGDRLKRAGYNACFAAENLGWGTLFAEPAKMMAGWLKSPGHRSNLLAPRATEYGLAKLSDPDGSHDPLWILVFGRPGC
jgi:uncharacterized protein YkwD